jgi:hypothetical protein
MVLEPVLVFPYLPAGGALLVYRRAAGSARPMPGIRRGRTIRSCAGRGFDYCAGSFLK